MNDSYALQISELKKLGFIFFERLAFGRDPLTYTFADAKEAKYVQVRSSRSKHKVTQKG